MRCLLTPSRTAGRHPHPNPLPKGEEDNLSENFDALEWRQRKFVAAIEAGIAIARR